MDYIQNTRPQLLPLYREIYDGGNRSHWEMLDNQRKAYAYEIGLEYGIHDDSVQRPFGAPPVIVNYFYHEQIKKSTRKGGDRHAGIAGSGNHKTGA